MPDIYRVDERRQRRRYITAEEAARMYSDAQARGDSALEGGPEDFAFWLHDVFGSNAVRVHVFVIGSDDTPDTP